MVGVVPLGVVGVHRVRHVGGDAERARQRPRPVLLAAAARRQGPRQHALQQRALGARLGTAPDLLVVEGRQHRYVGGPCAPRRRVHQRRHPGVYGDLVVQPGRHHELPVHAQVSGRLHVVQHQVPGQHVRRVLPGGRRDPAQQFALARLAQRPDRRDVSLPVQGHALVHRAVQVDGQLGHAQQGFVDLDQPVARDAVRAAQGEPAGDAEVPVEPGVQRDPAVDLHADLPPARGPGVRRGFDPEVRRVGVGADDPERGVGGCVLGDVPGDQRPGAGDEAAARRPRPVVRAAQFAEPGLLQALGRARHHVVRGRAGGDEGEQVVGVAAVGGRSHTASAFPVFGCGWEGGSGRGRVGMSGSGLVGEAGAAVRRDGRSRRRPGRPRRRGPRTPPRGVPRGVPAPAGRAGRRTPRAVRCTRRAGCGRSRGPTGRWRIPGTFDNPSPGPGAAQARSTARCGKAAVPDPPPRPGGRGSRCPCRRSSGRPGRAAPGRGR